jgi:hypothetical protein
MAGPVDLELVDGDLAIAAGEASLIDGAEQVAQALDTHLHLFRGEWFLDRSFGVPWFESILGQRMIDISTFDAILKSEILGVEGVNRIVAYESEFLRATRTYSVSFSADTIYGPISYEGVVP